VSPKQLLRIALVLVAALFLWGLAELVGRRGDTLERAAVFPPVDSTGVDVVEIAGDDTIRLARAGGGWTVNGYEAAASVVGELFAGLQDSTAGELVARSASSHERMGVDSAGGSHLRVFRGGDTLVHLVAGVRGHSYRSRYVRRAGDEEVYLLQGPLTQIFDRTLADWREKGIADVEADSVHVFAVERSDGSYRLERRDSVWAFANGAPADTAAVRRALEGYRALSAQGTSFATPAQADSADFDRPDRRVVLLGPRGDTLLALAFDSTAAGYWVRRAGGSTIYQLYRWKVDEIAPADSALRGADR
jgi:hypothetical protein